MIKLVVKSIDNTNYVLVSDNKTYNINMEFYDIEKQPKENDYIYMNEKLLDKNYEEYDTVYRFGSVNSQYGRTLSEYNEEDMILLVIEDKSIYLKRLFG